MATELGVDVALDVRSPAPTDPSLTVWQAICKWLGGKPAFVARYTGRGGAANANPLTIAEIDFIVAQERVPLLPVYNDSPINMGSEPTAQQGTLDARMALQWASQHGMPDNTYIAFDIEASTQVSVAYLQALTGEMRASRLAGSGMVYGSTGKSVFLGQALDAASNDQNVRRLELWSAAWFNVPPNPIIPTDGISLAAMKSALSALGGWAPAPSALYRPSVWQFAAGCFGGLCDEDFIDDRLLETQSGGSLWLPPTHSSTTAGTPSTTPTSTVTTTHQSQPSGTTTTQTQVVAALESQAQALVQQMQDMIDSLDKFITTLGGS